MVDQVAGAVAQLTSGAFAGSCAYIALVQQPVRASLPPGASLGDFRAAVPRAERLQAPLLVLALVAVAVEAVAAAGAAVVVGGLLLLAVLVQTVALVLPINRRLLSGAPEEHLAAAPRALARWGRLHAARTALAVVGAVVLQL